MNRKLYLTLSLTVASLIYVVGQISQGGTPYSFKNNLELKLVKKEITYPEDLMNQRRMNEGKNGERFDIAQSLPVNETINSSGEWLTLENGDRLWHLTVISEGALGLGLAYDEFFLPPGAVMYVYNKSKTQVLGAYTSFNNPENGYFANELVEGDEVTIEIYEPKSAFGNTRLSISNVAHAYRDVHFLSKYSERDFGDSDYCLVNVNCPEGDDWQDEKRGVARILVKAGNQYGWCSGSLINNTNEDCTPLFLTANHCADGSSDSDLGQWIFYFNYEAEGCDDPSTQGSLASTTITGCTKKSSGSTSDFYLVELNQSPPASWDPYYNGWDRSNTASGSGTSIHHPSGDIKKISTYTSTLTNGSWSGVSGTHWRVSWAQTQTAHSVTEGGSSGSPIFNADGNIVGQLHGGSSYCSQTWGQDLYGKVWYSWNPSGSSSSQELKAWLDPNNTGVTSLAGTNVPCSNQLMNDAEVLSIGSPESGEMICGSTFTPWVTLKNNGFNTLTSAEFTYVINGQTYSYSYTGSITTGGSMPVYFPSVTIPSSGDYTMTVSVDLPNGETDEDASNNDAEVDFSMNLTGELIKIRIKKDLNGSEITWILEDDQGTLIASGGPYNDNNLAWENEYVCVNEGCYTFTISDSGGDGICCDNGSGRYEILTPDGSVILGMSDGQYGSEHVKPFCWLTSVEDEESNNQFEVFPVPNDGRFYVNYKLTDAEDAKVIVVDQLGRVVETGEFSTSTLSNYELDLSYMSNGSYQVILESASGRSVKQIQIIK